MATKQDIIANVSVFLQGTHERLGVESPVISISELPARLISNVLLEEEHLLERMLADYYEYSDHSPSDEGEHRFDMEMMRDVYLHNPSQSSQARLSAYANNTQDDFLEGPAEVIACQACGNHCYYIGSLAETPVCIQCHKDETVLADICVWAIPVYVDVDTFCWEEPDMPDPETYEDACAMYG